MLDNMVQNKRVVVADLEDITDNIRQIKVRWSGGQVVSGQVVSGQEDQDLRPTMGSLSSYNETLYVGDGQLF